MAATSTPSRAAPDGAGSTVGFLGVVVFAVVAALGVMQLEIQGAPWPVPVQPQFSNPVPVLGAPQARVLRRDASSDAVSRDGRTSGLQRVGNASGN